VIEVQIDLLNRKRAQQCARCGNCTVVCPVYEITGRESLTARGKMHLLNTELAANPSTNYQDLFARCLLCGACEQVCSRKLNIRQLIVEARSKFPSLYGRHGIRKSAVRLVLSRSKLLEGLARAGVHLKNLKLLPAESGLRLKLDLLEPKEGTKSETASFSGQNPLVGRKAILYFPGCAARYLQPGIAVATGRLCRTLAKCEPTVPEDQVCCGLAAWSSGGIAEARVLAQKNIAAFTDYEGPVITSCASCSSFLQSYPALFEDDPNWHARAVSFSSRVMEFSSFFLPVSEGRTFMPESQLRLYYHEPCHLRFDARNRKPSQDLIGKIAAARLDSSETQRCCGQGGLFHIGYPELSEKIFSSVYARLSSTGSGTVVTTCSGCLMQWQAGLALRNSSFNVKHLAVLLAECLEENN
jgi:glycolate oxidase iron-sulfur subunit